MWDLSGGNYSVHRQFSWPDFPGSSIVASAEVSTEGRKMTVTATVDGTYDGPMDLVGVANPVEVNWTQGDGNNVDENNHGVVIRQEGEPFAVDYTSAFSGLSQPLVGDQSGEYRYSNMSWDGTTLRLDWQGKTTVGEILELAGTHSGNVNKVVAQDATQ